MRSDVDWRERWCALDDPPSMMHGSSCRLASRGERSLPGPEARRRRPQIPMSSGKDTEKWPSGRRHLPYRPPSLSWFGLDLTSSIHFKPAHGADEPRSISPQGITCNKQPAPCTILRDDEHVCVAPKIAGEAETVLVPIQRPRKGRRIKVGVKNTGLGVG